MSETDDAWDAVQAKLKTLAEALADFRQVKVRTMLTELEWETETVDGARRVTGIQPAADPASAPRGLVTTIDMMTGDIAHDASPALSAEELTRLETAHAAHLEIGRKIFADNIRLVADTVQRFARGAGAAE